MKVERRAGDRAFLLRCWQEGTAGEGITWRYSLKEVLDERRQLGFADLQEVFDFLAAQLDETAES